MIRTSNIDIGNDSVKSIMGEEKAKLYIPNVIAHSSSKREVFEMEKEITDGIHLSIISDAINPRQGFFKVGNLARATNDLMELKSDSQKTNSDQTMILLLATLAIDAATSGKFSEANGIIEANYYVSTGLPISEASPENRKIFKEKLENSVHEIHFLQTPQLSGKRVRIHIKKALVNIEGLASYVYLSERNSDITNKTVLLLDIGGLTTDVAIIRKNTVDNTNSKGINGEGVSPYLDRIIERLHSEFRYPIKNRKDLVEVITYPVQEERNYIFIKGQKTSIEQIVNSELANLAVKQYQFITQMWESVPDLRAAFVIGGGAVVLKEYLEKVNITKDSLPLYFLESNESIWMNVLSYEKILNLWLQKQKEKEMIQYAY